MNFDWLKKLFGIKEKSVQFLGVLGEGISENVHEFREAVASASPALWSIKTKDTWRNFLSQYQYISSACVAFTISKIAQVLYFLKTKRKVKFSPGWIYKRRTPKILGMYVSNAINLASQGMITEELYPSEGLNETEINSITDLGNESELDNAFAISKDWINLPLDFDTIASTIEKTEKAVLILCKFGKGEWFGTNFPKVLNVNQIYSHAVAVVDAGTMNGVQYLKIEDSAEKDSFNVKYLTRSFFDRRVTIASYPINFKFDKTPQNPPSYDKSISSLQDCLTFEGVFPSNITSRGVMGSITIKAIKDFQARYNIQQTGTVGPITEKKLLELFP